MLSESPGCDGDDGCWCPRRHQRDQGVRKPGLRSKCCPGLALLSLARLNIGINPGSTCKHSGDRTEAASACRGLLWLLLETGCSILAWDPRDFSSVRCTSLGALPARGTLRHTEATPVYTRGSGRPPVERQLNMDGRPAFERPFYVSW